MTYQKIGQFFKTGIAEVAVGIAPLAVFLIEKSVTFHAYISILKRHTTALTDELLRRAEQSVDGHAEKL
jgi:hypothetical protein